MSFNSKWDYRFLDLAAEVSKWSKDPSTQVGAVIIRPDKTVASVGFNGFPRYFEDNVEDYGNREKKYARIIHGEINAILNAKEPLNDFTLYTVPFSPCDRCALQIIQSGISSVVSYFPSEELQARWGDKLEQAINFFMEADVDVRLYERN